MGKGRLEAFSDGVIAIVITIMVLELEVPQSSDVDALQAVLPAFLSYVLSFLYVGIYWNNHHHVFQTVERVSGMTLWANLHLLFWLSLIPFVTRWMDESRFGTWPVVAGWSCSCARSRGRSSFAFCFGATAGIPGWAQR